MSRISSLRGTCNLKMRLIRNLQPRLKVRKLSSTSAFYYALASSLVTSLAALQFKLYKWLPSLEVNALSYLNLLFLSLPLWVSFSPCKVQKPRNYKLFVFLLLKCLSSVVSSIFYAMALKRIPAHLVYMILSAIPLLSAIMSRIFLKEALSVLRVIALLLTISGVVLIKFLNVSLTRFPVSGDWVYGILCAFVSSLTGAVMFVGLKKTVQLDSYSVCMVQGLMGAPITIALLAATGNFIVPPCGSPAFVILLASCKYTFVTILLHHACTHGDVGPVSAMLTGMNIIFSFVWEIMFFGVVPSWTEFFAAILIIVGALINGFGKYVIPRTYHSVLRRGL